jgi:hypothetical protein
MPAARRMAAGRGHSSRAAGRHFFCHLSRVSMHRFNGNCVFVKDGLSWLCARIRQVKKFLAGLYEPNVHPFEENCS